MAGAGLFWQEPMSSVPAITWHLNSQTPPAPEAPLSTMISSLVAVVYSLSRVQLLVIPWTVARQVPLSMGFPRQDYWSGLPFFFPGDLSNAGIEPTSPALQVDS